MGLARKVHFSENKRYRFETAVISDVELILKLLLSSRWYQSAKNPGLARELMDREFYAIQSAGIRSKLTLWEIICTKSHSLALGSLS